MIVDNLISFARELFGGALTDWQYSLLAFASVCIVLWFIAYVLVGAIGGGRR